MALTIENASVGYDENNLSKTLSNVHNNCVIEAKTELRNKLSELNSAVNDCWVGQSAETFKSNMQHDVEEICKGLDAAYEGLEAEFNKVIAGLSEVDQQLIDAR
jgi:uncharacterized protein YukE